jgi:hypothetical protein
MSEVCKRFPIPASWARWILTCSLDSVHWVLGLSARLVRGAGPVAGWMDRETVLSWVGFLLLATVLGTILDWWGPECSVWFECDIDKRCDSGRVPKCWWRTFFSAGLCPSHCVDLVKAEACGFRLVVAGSRYLMGLATSERAVSSFHPSFPHACLGAGG